MTNQNTAAMSAPPINLVSDWQHAALVLKGSLLLRLPLMPWHVGAITTLESKLSSISVASLLHSPSTALSAAYRVVLGSQFEACQNQCQTSGTPVSLIALEELRGKLEQKRQAAEKLAVLKTLRGMIPAQEYAQIKAITNRQPSTHGLCINDSGQPLLDHMEFSYEKAFCIPLSTGLYFHFITFDRVLFDDLLTTSLLEERELPALYVGTGTHSGKTELLVDPVPTAERVFIAPLHFAPIVKPSWYAMAKVNVFDLQAPAFSLIRTAKWSLSSPAQQACKAVEAAKQHAPDDVSYCLVGLYTADQIKQIATAPAETIDALGLGAHKKGLLEAVAYQYQQINHAPEAGENNE